jgi:3-phenylpropionate/cinnamic acid dioxygenase small subunit
MQDRSTATLEGTEVLRGLVSTRRVRASNPVYHDLIDALNDEAAALDERRFADWSPMLAEDLIYTAPIRLTRTGLDGDRDVMRIMMHFKEDKPSIMQRLRRLDKNCAWAEDPPSRTRRFVSNIRIAEAETPGEFEVVSYLLLKRSRGDSARTEEVSAERRDVWRAVGDGYQLARREIIVDQSVLSMSNFAIFL